MLPAKCNKNQRLFLLQGFMLWLKQQIRSSSSRFEQQLGNFKATYDTEDVLHKFGYKLLKRRVKGKGKSTVSIASLSCNIIDLPEAFRSHRSVWKNLDDTAAEVEGYAKLLGCISRANQGKHTCHSGKISTSTTKQHIWA